VKQVAGGLGANQLPPVVAAGGISNTANMIPQQPLAPGLAKRPSLCVSSIRLYSRAANMRQTRSASNASAYRD